MTVPTFLTHGHHFVQSRQARFASRKEIGGGDNRWDRGGEYYKRDEGNSKDKMKRKPAGILQVLFFD